MAFKQPKVPEYRGGDGIEKYIRTLALFLKDFCQDAWTASRMQRAAIDGVQKGIDGIRYPVMSVNGKTGEVTLGTDDIGALGANEAAKDAAKLDGKTWSQILDALYPVGCICISAEETSPAARYGGTWERIQDRFLLAAGESFAAGTTGGEAAHTLTTDEMPGHSHDIALKVGASSSGGALLARGTNWSTTFYENDGSAYPPIVFGSSGGGAAHNNMPPYLAVYMWKRVS